MVFKIINESCEVKGLFQKKKNTVHILSLDCFWIIALVVHLLISSDFMHTTVYIMDWQHLQKLGKQKLKWKPLVLTHK